MNKTVKIHDIGLVDYEEALNFQLKLFNEIIDTKISNRIVMFCFWINIEWFYWLISYFFIFTV